MRIMGMSRHGRRRSRPRKPSGRWVSAEDSQISRRRGKARSWYGVFMAVGGAPFRHWSRDRLGL